MLRKALFLQVVVQSLPGASEASVGLTMAALDVTECSDPAYFNVPHRTVLSLHQCNAIDLHICLGSEEEMMTASWFYLSRNYLQPRARRLQRRSQLLSVSFIQTARSVPRRRAMLAGSIFFSHSSQHVRHSQRRCCDGSVSKAADLYLDQSVCHMQVQKETLHVPIPNLMNCRPQRSAPEHTCVH